MPATSVSGRPSISSVGTLPSGLTARKSAERVSLLWNDTGTASKGAPTSLSAICGAIELAPGAKYSVSIRFTSPDPAHSGERRNPGRTLRQPAASEVCHEEKHEPGERSPQRAFRFFRGSPSTSSSLDEREGGFTPPP